MADNLRVRVAYTITASPEYRRAIRRFYGQDGLASRDEVRRWLEAYGSSMDDDLSLRYYEDESHDAA